MQTKHAILHQCRQWQVIEQVREETPDLRAAVLSEAFVVEAVYLGDLAGFVIAPQNVYPRGISHLETDQEGHSLDAVIAAVDVIAQKEVVRIGHLAAHAEQFDEIVELAVQIAHEGDGGGYGLDVRFAA